MLDVNSSLSVHHSSVNPLQQLCPPVLLTVRQFAEKHKAFTNGSLRSLIFNARSRESSNGLILGNGLESSLIRIGKRLLIDEAMFFTWVRSQSNG